MSSQEQRKHPRVPIDISLDLFAKGSVVSRGPGRITDLSLGGVKIETKAVFHISEHIVLRFDLTALAVGEAGRGIAGMVLVIDDGTSAVAEGGHA